MSSDSLFSPEPLRDAFESDEAHLRAWLEWADGTPGGWQARWAERTRGDARGRRIRIEHDGDTNAGAIVHVGSSPCCRVQVIVDPLVTELERGMCSSCCAILDRTPSGWRPAP
jgi:hypothetical protein